MPALKICLDFWKVGRALLVLLLKILVLLRLHMIRKVLIILTQLLNLIGIFYQFG